MTHWKLRLKQSVLKRLEQSLKRIYMQRSKLKWLIIPIRGKEALEGTSTDNEKMQTGG